MVKSVQQIKYEILAYIKEFGGNFQEWYIGIAENPKQEMFTRHGVNQSDDIWLYKQALTFTACKTVQQYFVNTLKVDGQLLEKGDENTDCVYLYKKSSRTKP